MILGKAKSLKVETLRQLPEPPKATVENTPRLAVTAPLEALEVGHSVLVRCEAWQRRAVGARIHKAKGDVIAKHSEEGREYVVRTIWCGVTCTRTK